MAIVRILKNTGLLLLCSIIQFVGIVVEGLSRIFGQCAKYLEILHDKIVVRVKPRRKSIDIPL